MRDHWLAAACVLLILPTAVASNAVSFPDDAGDVKGAVSTGLGGDPPLPAGYEHVDLLNLEVIETADEWEWNFLFGDEPPDALEGRRIDVSFRYDTHYQIQYPTGTACGSGQGILMRLEEEWRRAHCLSVTDEGETIKIHLPKAALVPPGFPVPGIGEELTNLRVISWGYQREAYDLLDDAMGELMQIRHGQKRPSDFWFASTEPIRKANGEPTTLLLDVLLHNNMSTPQSFALETSGLPTDWNAKHPSAAHIEAGANATVPVLITTSSAHVHGSTSVFLLEAENLETGLIRNISVGIHFLEVPQPTGHHPVLFLHAEAAGTALDAAPSVLMQRPALWMNTLGEDPQSGESVTKIPGGGSYAPQQNPLGTTASWTFPLAPKLMLGLDADVSRQAKFTAALENPWDLEDGELTVRLCTSQIYPGGDYGCPNPLAEGSMQVSSAGRTPIDLILEATPAFEHVPRNESQNLVLRIELASESRGVAFFVDEAILDIQDARLELPLREYHEPAPPVLDNMLPVVFEETLSVRVNPGRAAAIPVVATYGEEQSVTLSAGYFGTHADWVQTPESMRFKPGKSTEAVVRVQAPPEAMPGSIVKGYFFLESRAGALALLPLQVEVVSVEDHDIPDAGTSASGGRESPGLPVAILTAAIMLLVRRLR